MNKLGSALFGAFVCILIIIGLYFFTSQRQDQVHLAQVQGEKIMEEEVEETVQATLVYLEGNVEYLDEDGKWRGVEEGADMSQGDLVRVLEGGKAVIVFDDGSVARLNGGTSIRFEELKSDHIAVLNSGGDLYTRVAKSGSSLFDVVVGENIYRAAGTAFRTFNTESKKGLEVYESSVEIIKEDRVDLVVKEGKAYFEINLDDEENEGEIVKIKVETLEGDEFVVWNKQEDQKNEEFKEDLGVLEEIETAQDSSAGVEDDSKKETTKTTIQKDQTTNVSSIALSSAGEASVSWSVNGESENGFKIVWSKSANPTYPLRSGDKYIYLSDKNARSTTLNPFDGKGTYYVRVCEYLGGKCGKYSNQIKVQL